MSIPLTHFYKKTPAVPQVVTRLAGNSCPPLNVFDLSSYALEIKDIATSKMMLLRHALHDKCASLNFASGDQHLVAGPRPRTTRCGITATQNFL